MLKINTVPERWGSSSMSTATTPSTSAKGTTPTAKLPMRSWFKAMIWANTSTTANLAISLGCSVPSPGSTSRAAPPSSSPGKGARYSRPDSAITAPQASAGAAASSHFGLLGISRRQNPRHMAPVIPTAPGDARSSPNPASAAEASAPRLLRYPAATWPRFSPKTTVRARASTRSPWASQSAQLPRRSSQSRKTQVAPRASPTRSR